MRDQGICRQGQNFITNEKREQVLCESQAHGRPDGNGETNIEPCLARFFVAAHVTDRENRVYHPQERGHSCENHAQWFDRESDF